MVRIDNNPAKGSGWGKVGGTSLAAPLIAGVYGLAGDFGGTSVPAKLAYRHASSLTDITSGSNGTCRHAVMCNGKPGYDGPTGLGAPNGLIGF